MGVFSKFFTRIFIIFLLFLPAAVLSGADTGGVTLSIRFYQQKIYYLNQSDVYLKVTLTNNSPSTYRFKVSENRFFNIDFEVRTLTNLVLDHSEKFIIERNSNQHVFFREVSLEPGEEYGFVVELNDFAVFESSGVYSVQALFYPSLLESKTSPFIGSNKLTISMRPPVVLKEMQAVIEAETGDVLVPQSLPPDDVVTYTINARQRSQWEKFFLYIDLESLLLRNPSRAVRYKKLSQADREKMIADFRKEMMQDKVEQEILVIPQIFTILETTYTPEQGKVTVLEKFKYRDYTENKRYTYYVRRKDSSWFIVDYSVVSIGTE